MKRQLVPAIALSLMALSVNADDFALQNNQVVVSAPGFSQAANIGSDGILATVTGIPKTAGLGIPSLSFVLAANGTIANGTYSFRIGVTLDDDNSDRRIEAAISRINLVVSNNGATIVSSIPAGTPLTVYGTEGSYIVSMTETNPSSGGPITVSGGTITFSADNLINQIKKSFAQLEPILDTFGGSAHYTYNIVAQQTSYSPSTARFGTLSAASFTPLPRIGTTCDSKSSGVFKLAPVMAQNYTAAYALQGQFSIVGATGSPGAAPAPFTGTCTTGNVGTGGGSSGGGSSGGSTGGQTTVATQNTALLNSLNAISLPASGAPGAAQMTAISSAIADADTLSTLAVQQINANTLTTAVAISTLETLARNLDLIGRARQRGGVIDQPKAIDAVANLTTLVSALATARTLSTAESQQISTLVLGALDDVAALITSTSSNADLDGTITAARQLVAASRAAGTPLTTSLVDATGAITHTAMLRGLPALASSLGITLNTDTAAQLRSGIQNNPALLERALQYAVPLEGALDAAVLRTRLTSRGLSSADAERIAASISATSTNLTGVAFAGGSNQGVLDAMAVALNGGSASFDATTGLLTLSGTDTREYFVITAARLVPDSLPEGRHSLPDGRTVVINNGLAFELAPASRNVLEFASVVEGAGFDINFTSNGSLDITLSPVERFSGAFASDTSFSGANECAQIGVTYPEGDPATAAYSFAIKCVNGPTQHVLPFIGSGTFYALGTEAALKITTDRNTGILTVPGIGFFKPSFFISSPSATDLVFLQQNELGRGLAFRPGDLNGDGVMDFEMISVDGRQVLYGVKP